MSDGLNDLPLWSEPVEPGPRPFLVPDLPPVRSTPPPATPTRTPGAAPASALDWELVRVLRSRAATELSVMDLAADQQTAAVAIVADLVQAHTASEMAAGRPAPSPVQATALARAVLDALFGLGRLQPHVDNPQVENIEVYGHDHVLLEMADGSLVDADPVADTDAELIETIAFAAARADGSPRPFSEAHPTLHLRLAGGARLAASYWTTPRPVVVIRLHRLVDVTLTDLVDRDMLDPVMASFLAASVRAGRSIVVSGPQGGGKTTLVRALCAELDPDERIGTIETERELHLHETGRHRRIVAWESRPGSGERGPDGRMAGEITLAELVEGSLRFNLSRLIVGEVRGREIISMFQAMQSGAGSMSTTHAPDARAAIERLVTCAMEANAPAEFAYRQVADHINLIVQIAMRTHTGPGGQRTRTRFVSEVLAVEPGESGRPATTSIWRADPVSGRAVPGVLPGHLADELARFGFDPGHLRRGAAMTPAVLFGAAIGTGLLLIVLGLLPRPADEVPAPRRRGPGRWARMAPGTRRTLALGCGRGSARGPGDRVDRLGGARPGRGGGPARPAAPRPLRDPHRGARGVGGMDPRPGRCADRGGRPGASADHLRPLRPRTDPGPGHRPGRPTALPHPHRRWPCAASPTTSMTPPPTWSCCR